MSFTGEPGGIRERLGIVDGDLFNFGANDLFFGMGDASGGAATSLGGVTAAGGAGGIGGGSGGGSVGLLELRWFGIEEAR